MKTMYFVYYDFDGARRYLASPSRILLPKDESVFDAFEPRQGSRQDFTWDAREAYMFNDAQTARTYIGNCFHSIKAHVGEAVVG